MAVGANSNLRSKEAYKTVLLFIKVLPILLAILSLLTTIMDYFLINTTIINYIILGCLIAFMYLVSYVFRFCFYHRMFLHYFTAVNLISMYDSFIGIPLNNYHLFQLYIIFTCVCMIIILYHHVKFTKKGSNISHR